MRSVILLSVAAILACCFSVAMARDTAPLPATCTAATCTSTTCPVAATIATDTSTAATDCSCATETETASAEKRHPVLKVVATPARLLWKWHERRVERRHARRGG